MDKEVLMTKEQIHNLGIRIMADFFESNGYNIIYVVEEYGNNPSFVVEKDNNKIAVMLMVDISPNIPTIGVNKYTFIDYAKANNYIPYFASLSVSSSNEERKAQSIALLSDDFIIEHLSIERVEEDTIEINTEEYYKYKMTLLSNVFLNKNYDALNNLTSNDCKLFNNLTKEEIKDINNIKDYLNNNINTYTPDGYSIIKTVGMYGEFKTQNLTIEGIEEVIKDAKIKVLQEPDKIMAIVQYKENIFDNNIPAIILNCDFNQEGIINNIVIGDPRHFNYLKYDNIF